MKELRNFPTLAGTRVSHVWTGNVAMTRSDLPGIGQRDGIWFALGCNGSGMALMPLPRPQARAESARPARWKDGI